MFKLKLTVWHRTMQPSTPSVYLGTAFDHRSFSALEYAIRAGCYGPMSKTKFYTLYVDPDSGCTENPFFEKRKGKWESVLPFVVSSNWLDQARRNDGYEESSNKIATRRTRFRKHIATKWALLPFDWCDISSKLVRTGLR